MKVVLAFDKFKGTATAHQLCEAAQAALDGIKGLDVACIALADGGEGTTAALAAHRQGQWIDISTPAPLVSLPPVDSRYFLCDDGTAIVELAAAGALALVPHERRDPMRATTLGTGLMMRDAMERGSKHIVLGLGGSATTDAGMGILCALGVEFMDKADRHLFPCGENLQAIERIDTVGVPDEVRECRFTLLTDVDAPLCGKRGTAHVFAPQKGATPEQVNQLEHGMSHIAAIVGPSIATRPGCGAAGGVPALMSHLLDCEWLAGAPFVLAQCGFETLLRDADLVITGEGRLDRQTLMGKGPGCVIKAASEKNVPVLVVCGQIDPELDITSLGVKTAIAVSDGLPRPQAMDHDGTLARVAAAVHQQVMQLINE